MAQKVVSTTTTRARTPHEGMTPNPKFGLSKFGLVRLGIWIKGIAKIFVALRKVLHFAVESRNHMQKQGFQPRNCTCQKLKKVRKTLLEAPLPQLPIHVHMQQMTLQGRSKEVIPMQHLWRAIHEGSKKVCNFGSQQTTFSFKQTTQVPKSDLWSGRTSG